MFAERVADRLRRMRKSAGFRQQRVAEALELSVSAISRLERGIRGLRVEQLVAWAECLGYRAEVVFYEPVRTSSDDKDGSANTERLLDDESILILADVAAVLPHMPTPARMALAHQMQLWREAAISGP
jgi:transcriptional regulator with XRE-family HTH domain